MKSKIEKRNILSVEKGIIIHQVNCKGVMGKGVAKAISDKYPIVKEKYLRLCQKKTEEELFGKVQLIKISDTLAVCNIFSQKAYGNYGKFTDELILTDAIARIAEKFPEHEIYAPFGIGAGLGGGDWEIIFGRTKNIPNLTYCRI